MAFESLLKLGAMLALGAFVWFGLPSARSRRCRRQAHTSDGFAPLMVLGALAMFTLPHQFHVGVVECRDDRDLRTARWLFPLYMLLIALPILPLARAGDALLAPLGVPSDLYVLALPLSQGTTALALLAFLGGLQRRHRHGDGQHAGAEPDDRQSLADAVLLRGAGRSARRRRPARRRADAAARRHSRVVLLAWAYSRADRRQRCAGRYRGGVLFRTGDAGAGAGLRGLAAADAAARGRCWVCSRRSRVGLGACWCRCWRTHSGAPAGCSEVRSGSAWLAPDSLFGPARLEPARPRGRRSACSAGTADHAAAARHRSRRPRRAGAWLDRARACATLAPPFPAGDARRAAAGRRRLARPRCRPASSRASNANWRRCSARHRRACCWMPRGASRAATSTPSPPSSAKRRRPCASTSACWKRRWRT